MRRPTTMITMGMDRRCRVLVEYVLRRANGYFIYSTVEGVSIASGPGII